MLRNAYERYDYPVAVCFSRDDADAEASRRGERFKPGWAGFAVRGPVASTTAPPSSTTAMATTSCG